MDSRYLPTPYCGAPPSPDSLLARWNLDPILIVALLALGAAYLAGASRAGLDRRERALFAAGWAIAAAAVISPLCALSVSLFSARVGQHMILTLVAAPLAAAGRPHDAFARLCGLSAPARRGGASVMAAAGLYAVLLWLWHAPGPYAATFSSVLVYWAMHLSLFGSALWLWGGLLARRPLRPAWSVLAGLASTVQMGLLGALITLAPRALYAPHALTTAAWGLSPLQDQQLGGAIMWVPGCLAFLAAAAVQLWAVLEPGPGPRLKRAGGLAPPGAETASP